MHHPAPMGLAAANPHRYLGEAKAPTQQGTTWRGVRNLRKAKSKLCSGEAARSVIGPCAKSVRSVFTSCLHGRLMQPCGLRVVQAKICIYAARGSEAGSGHSLGAQPAHGAGGSPADCAAASQPTGASEEQLPACPHRAGPGAIGGAVYTPAGIHQGANIYLDWASEHAAPISAHDVDEAFGDLCRCFR